MIDFTMTTTMEQQRNNTQKLETYKRKRWTLGLFILSVVMFCWVTSSFITNNIFENNLYRKPFFITYLDISVFMVYLIPFAIKVAKIYRETGEFNYEIIEAEFENDITEQQLENVDSELSPIISSRSAMQPQLNLKETMKLSAQFSFLWYVANLATNASLSFTSVASQTILSTTSSFFTLIIGYLVGIEKLNKYKVFGVLLSFLGVVLITEVDNGNETSRTRFNVMLGNFFALSGALIYGVYTTLLKYCVKDESRINMKFFFGFVGLFNTIFFWPSLVLFHVLGIEKFQLPNTWYIIFIVSTNAIISLVSDYCWVKAMLLTSPLTVTVGLSATIPLAMLGDVILKHERMKFLYIVSAMMIGFSFFIINKYEEIDEINETLYEE